MGGRPAGRARGDARGVTIARLTGVAAAYAQVRRMTRPEALAELDQVLDEAGARDPAHRVELLTAAAAAHVDTPDHHPTGWWAGRAVDLLAEAGADLHAARQHPTAKHRRRRGWARAR